MHQFRPGCRPLIRSVVRDRGDSEDHESGVPVHHGAGRARLPGKRSAELTYVDHVDARIRARTCELEDRIDRGRCQFGQTGEVVHSGPWLGRTGADHRELGVGPVLDAVVQRGRRCAHRRDQILPVRFGSEVGDPDVDGEAAPQDLRDAGDIGRPDQGDRRREFVGNSGRELLVGVKHRRGILARVDQAARVDPPYGKQRELQRGHHTEVALATAQGPEEVRFGIRRGVAQHAVGSDHVDAPHMIGRPAAGPAHGEAEPATERVPDDPDRRRRPGQRCEARPSCFVDSLSPADPGVDPGRLSDRVDRYAVHPAGRDQDPVVDDHGRPVPGREDGHGKVVSSGEADGGLDISGTRGAHDERGRCVTTRLKPATSSA